MSNDKPVAVSVDLEATRSCNRHLDCDAADESAKAAGRRCGADHCRDECCEDCFGN